jgi:hypothetical protein
MNSIIELEDGLAKSIQELKGDEIQMQKSLHRLNRELGESVAAQTESIQELTSDQTESIAELKRNQMESIPKPKKHQAELVLNMERKRTINMKRNQTALIHRPNGDYCAWSSAHSGALVWSRMNCEIRRE